ncbi:MAG: cyclophilin-like fold protein [Ignisphaera sp.]
MFMLECIFKDIGTSVVVDVKKYTREIEEKLPFNSSATVWKQEIYFPTPITLDLPRESLIHKIHRGGVYYWPPGKALCLFYGITQPYTPVAYIGEIVDPTHALYNIKNASSVEVFKHTVDNQFTSIAEVLNKLGYTIATPLRNGEKVVVAYKLVDGRRYSIQLYVEDYGIHIESEGVVRYRDDLKSYLEISALNEVVSGYARLDLSEEGFIVLTAAIDSINEMEEAIRDLEKSVDRAVFMAKI